MKSIVAKKSQIGEDGKYIKKSVLSKRTKRVLLGLKHYKFRERLIQKSSEYPNTEIYMGNESHTTMTCGKCLEMNKKVGSSKVFKCINPECGVILDRDFNGARNFMLKSMI